MIKKSRVIHGLIKYPLLRKSVVMVGIIAVFIIGKYIPLPRIPLDTYLTFSPELTTLTGLTGGDLSQIGLFALGLGPSMYAMLLSQLFTVGKKAKVTSPRLVAFRKNGLMLVISLIQGLAIAVGILPKEHGGNILDVGIVTVVLIAGAFVIDWLGTMNTVFGIGGPTIIVIANILLTQIHNIPQVIKLWEKGEQEPLIFLGFWILLTIYLIVITERAEYRIPIQRISIHSDYAKGSYLPIKVNIAGGMPLMYAYSFLAFPQYFLMLLVFLKPNWSFLKTLSTYFTTATVTGIVVYLVVIIILTLSLAQVNMDVFSKVETMRNAGDYISGIRPGKATQDYLTKHVLILGWVNAMVLVILSGVPLFLFVNHKELQPLAGTTGIFMMFTGLFFNLVEEIQTMQLKKQYKSIF